MTPPRSGERRGRIAWSWAGAQARSLFFNRLWIGGAALVLLVGVATGSRALTLLPLLVLAAALAMALWNRATLARLSYSRELSLDRVFPGDRTELAITVVNEKPLPVPWLTIDEEISQALHPVGRPTTMSGVSGRRVLQLQTRLGPYERVTWRIPLDCPSRGVQTIGPATLRANDPLGFFANRSTVKAACEIIVYPRLRDLPQLALPPRQAMGETRVHRHLLTDPLRVVGIRPYRPEDPFRMVHWKATARQGALQVRVAEPSASLQVGIFVNLDTFDHYWEGLDIPAAEAAIETGASIAARAESTRAAAGVYANGIVAGSDQTLRIPPGRGRAQLFRMLEGLAKVSPYSTVTFAKIVQAEATRFPFGSTLIVVTGMMPEALVAQLRSLLAAGQRVVLVALDGCPIPALRGLVVRRVTSAWPSTPEIGEAAGG